MSSNEGNSVIQGTKEYRDRGAAIREEVTQTQWVRFSDFSLKPKEKNQPYGIIRSVMFSLINIKAFSWKSVETHRRTRICPF